MQNMGNSAKLARTIFDTRVGGPYNVLLVETRDHGYEAWVVDYDRWRDEGWTADQAYREWPIGGRVPVLLRLLPLQVQQIAERMQKACDGADGDVYEEW
jgi:hypothetical protein